MIIYGKRKAHKFLFSDQNSGAVSLHSLPDQFPILRQLLHIHDLVIIGIQIDSRLPEDMSQQKLCIKAGFFDTMFLK